MFVSYLAAAWSTVGKKLLMAITGLLLIVFVLFHLAGNLLILSPQTTVFNIYSNTLVSLGDLLIVAEVLLLILFLVHFISAIAVYLVNRSARPQGYAVYKSQGSPSRKTIASSTMIWTGLVLAVFIPLHIITFKYGPGIAQGYYVTMHGEKIRDMRRLVLEIFHQGGYVAWYVAALGLLGFHLSHGFWSSFQSIGANRPRFTPIIYTIGYFVALIVAIGFIIIPLWIYFHGVPA